MPKLMSSWFGTLSLGPVWENAGDTQSFYLAPNIEETYSANPSSHAYEFADWGMSQLSRASGQTINSGLSLSHLYTNGFLFNLTYHA